jgi:hypothetical protein
MGDHNLSATFWADGYEVVFTLERTEGDSVSGYMADMFEMKGKKIE